MKRRHASSPPPSQRLRHTTVVVLVVAMLLVLMNSLGLLRPLQILSDQLVSPIQRTGSNTVRSIADKLGLISSVDRIGRDNKKLTIEVAQLKKQLSDMRELSRENELLRSQLGFNSRQSLDLAPARVVGYSPDNIRQFLTIDVGKGNGIRKGMAVTSNGALVGTIDQVNDFSSRVFLLSDVDFRIRALGQDGRANGIVAGQIGSGYSMDKLAQGETISRGETVITTGSDIIPKGLIIGTVESVESSDNAIFQLANIRPAINLSKLEIVFVVKGQK